MPARKQSQSVKTFLITADLVMMVLLLLNLLLILFDWLFQSAAFRGFLESVWPFLHDFYAANIHDDFILYDLIFIGIFLTEFVIRWIIAIWYREFSRWYYFPFVHWYDIIGCIPLAGFRFLRLLRVVSIGIRLHQRGWIDLTKLPIFDQLAFLINLFIGEVTDRVSLRILGNIRHELKDGTPVIGKIAGDVIKPRQDILIEWVSARIRTAATQGYAMHEDEIRNYVMHRINEAVEQNQELKQIEAVPVMGRYIVGQIEGAISDIVFNVIHGIIADLGSDRNREIIDDISEMLFYPDEADQAENMEMLNLQVADIISESLGIIMERIRGSDLKSDPDELERQERIKKGIESTLN